MLRATGRTKLIDIKRIRLRATRIAAASALCTLATIAAAQSGDLAQAEAALQARRFDEAARILGPLAAGGDPVAQLRLGTLHYLGRGVPEDEGKAFDWTSRAARHGLRDAQFQLAKMYTFRHGVPASEVDPDLQAAIWYFRSASQGHAEAQYSLGLMFMIGKGVEQNMAEAGKWMRRAAEQGFEAARAFPVDNAKR